LFIVIVAAMLSFFTKPSPAGINLVFNKKALFFKTSRALRFFKNESSALVDCILLVFTRTSHAELE